MSDLEYVWWAASVLPAVIIYAFGPTLKVALVAVASALFSSATIAFCSTGDSALMEAAAVVTFAIIYAAIARGSVKIAGSMTGKTPTEFLRTGLWLMEAPREVIVASAVWAVAAACTMAVSVLVFLGARPL
jgi:hypothetical protein